MACPRLHIATHPQAFSSIIGIPTENVKAVGGNEKRRVYEPSNNTTLCERIRLENDEIS